jgi:hypothetical protein
MATRLETRSEWLNAHPPERLTQSLAGVARRALAGEGFRNGVREFLDEFALAGDDRWREQAIAERPEPTADGRHDAYLGALAEHLAAVHLLARPPWSVEPDRFLEPSGSSATRGASGRSRSPRHPPPSAAVASSCRSARSAGSEMDRDETSYGVE